VRVGCGRSSDNFVGADESATGEAAGRYCLSWEKDHVLFSAGDFGGGECGVVDLDVSGGEVEAVIANRVLPGLWLKAKSL
jgi:hypothetical protein